MTGQLVVNKVVFLKHHAWYLSIVQTPEGGKDCCWSFHNRTGMNDNEAKKAFTREHFKEVSEIIRNKYSNKEINLTQQN